MTLCSTRLVQTLVQSEGRLVPVVRFSLFVLSLPQRTHFLLPTQE